MNDKSLLIAEYSNAKTNHVLHLLLTIFTAGVWVIPWILIAASNAGKRSKLRDQIEAGSH